MKCPKCGYLGFDSVDRCKNCGYEFSLMVRDSAPPDHADAPMTRGAQFRKTPSTTGGRGLDHRLAALPEGTPMDLPLFSERQASPPRAPLSVRRPTPVPVRARVRRDVRTPVPLELDLGSPPVDRPGAGPDAPMAAVEAFAVAPVAMAPLVARPGRRFGAASIDLMLLVAIDLILLWFTLRLCGLAPSEVGALPWAPLLGFFALLNGGYVTLFTGTLGQTLGKMAVGIRVVPLGTEAMSLRRALWRTLALGGSGGLGLVPATFGECRALHDRIAGTCVIQHTAAL